MKLFKKGAVLERMGKPLEAQLQNELQSDVIAEDGQWTPEQLAEMDDLPESIIYDLDESNFARVEFSEASAESTGYSNYSYWRCTFQAFWKNKMARTLLILLVALLLFTVIQPYLPNQKDPNEIFNEYDAYGMAKVRKNIKPNAEFWFGTDNVGHDLWSRIWSGTRTSLLLAFIVASVNCVVGITVGILWGYVRKMDALLTEIYNIMDNIPRTIILILMSYIMKPGMLTMIVSMCIVGWLGMARFIRNQVVMIRDRDYNLASRCLGTDTKKIMFRNLLPYLVSVIMLQTALAIPMVISDEVFLTYCGLGMPKSVPSLGGLVEDGRKVMMSASQRYQLIIPALVVTFITVSFYLIGNAFADASDPRNHV